MRKLRDDSDFTHHLHRLTNAQKLALANRALDKITENWAFHNVVSKKVILDAINDYLLSQQNFTYEMKHDLQSAKKIANEIVEKLKPFCERVEIGGSIRREKSEVKDIEIICVPRTTEKVSNGIFEQVKTMARVDGFVDAVNQIGTKEKGNAEHGKYCQRFLSEHGMKVDIFLTTPQNWGYIFMLRTGSNLFNQSFVLPNLKSWGYKLKNGEILGFKDKPVAVPTEQAVFDLMQESFIAPQDRKNVLNGIRVVDANTYFKWNKDCFPNGIYLGRYDKNRLPHLDKSYWEALRNPYGAIGSGAEKTCDAVFALRNYKEHLKKRLEAKDEDISKALNDIVLRYRKTGNVQLITDEADSPYAKIVKELIEEKL